MIKDHISEIMKLSVAERILLVEEIWDSIAANPESIPLSAEQKEDLDRRLEDYRANPEAGSSWEEIRERIRKTS